MHKLKGTKIRLIPFLGSNIYQIVSNNRPIFLGTLKILFCGQLRSIKPFTALSKSDSIGCTLLKKSDHYLSKRHNDEIQEIHLHFLKTLNVDEKFCTTTLELFQLSPALITHGGPGCVTIQVIHK